MRFGADCIEIRAKLDKLDKDLNDAKMLSERRAREIQRTAIIVFRGVAAYFGVRELTQFGSVIFETGKHFAQPEKAFKEIAGSIDAANREFDFLRRASDDLGQNFYNLAHASMADFASNMGAIVKSIIDYTKKELAAFAKGAEDYVDLWRFAAEEKIEPLLNFSFGNTTTNAKGNIYGPSGIIPFATGGIVNSPTPF